MYIILVYDVGSERVAKALKTCRKYINWIQNSVFEGEITSANFSKLKSELYNIIDENVDSVIFYTFRTMSYTNREYIGVEKGSDNRFI